MTSEKHTKQTDLAGHIVRSIILPETLQKEKPATFTTEPKKRKRTTINISRKGSIVKERCRQLTLIALDLFQSHKITSEDLKYLIVRYIGGDRGTVRAYMGYKGKVIHGKCGSVAIGNPRKGHLEVFSFMHPISNNKWFIHGQKTLMVPRNPPSLNIDERLIEKVSKEKISLSPPVKVSRVSDGLASRKMGDNYKINNNNTVRERNFRLQRIDENHELTVKTQQSDARNPSLFKVKKKAEAWV